MKEFRRAQADYTLRWTVTVNKIRVCQIRVRAVFKEKSPLNSLQQMANSNISKVSRTILEFETPSKVHDPFWIDLRLDAAKPRQIPTIHVF